MEDIKDKIRKLLNLANNKAATPDEAATAMRMAMALMAKHNIDKDAMSSGEKAVNTVGMTISKLNGGKVFPDWANAVASAASSLNACDFVFVKHKGEVVAYAFAGRDDNREAAKMMFEFLMLEVEKAYKRDLPKGLTKKGRAQWRQNYKFACSIKLDIRADEIVAEMKSKDQVLMLNGERIESRALVLATSYDQQLVEVADWMKEQGFQFKPPSKRRKPKLGDGTLEGFVAGSNISMQDEVEGQKP